MTDEELYIVTEPSGGNNTVHQSYKIFPFMKLLCADDENGIYAFYFYNQWNREQEEFLYICPYPSTKGQKHLPEHQFTHALTG